MKILWFTWKDKTHPEAGGAEIVNEELAERLVKDGHEVIFVVGAYENSKPEEVINGYKVVRRGNRYILAITTWLYYRKNLKGWADLVIDEVNTMPFFAKFYVKEPNIIFIHMLCREIWFYQLPKFIALAGYLLEPLYLRLLSDRKVITVSESTKKDLMRHGFKAENISIISEGIEIEPVKNLNSISKYQRPTLLSLGAMRPMKRTLDQIKAFEMAKATIPDLQIKVAGDTSGKYGETVLEYIRNSRYTKDIEVLGRVSISKKIELMQKSHLLLYTSIKEGWGLVATEANSQGTPTVAYDVDGLRDSVKHEHTGLVCDPNPTACSDAIIQALTDHVLYKNLEINAYSFSKEVTFEQSHKDFKRIIQTSGR